MSLSCPDAINVSIQFYKVCVGKYEGRSLQRFREISPRESSNLIAVGAKAPETITCRMLLTYVTVYSKNPFAARLNLPVDLESSQSGPIKIETNCNTKTYFKIGFERRKEMDQR